MLGEVSTLRNMLGQAEKKIAGLQKELDRVQSSVTVDEAKQIPLEKRSKELEAKNALLRAEIQRLKIDNSAQRQEARYAQVQVYNYFPTSPASLALATEYRNRLI